MSDKSQKLLDWWATTTWGPSQTASTLTAADFTTAVEKLAEAYEPIDPTHLPDWPTIAPEKVKLKPKKKAVVSNREKQLLAQCAKFNAQAEDLKAQASSYYELSRTEHWKHNEKPKLNPLDLTTMAHVEKLLMNDIKPANALKAILKPGWGVKKNAD